MAANATIFGILKWVAWLTWIAVGLPEGIKFGKSPELLSATSNIAWIAAYFSFVPALWVSEHKQPDRGSMPINIAGLVAAMGSVFLMIASRPGCYAAALAVVVAWQGTLLLPPLWSLVLIGLQTLGILYVFQRIAHDPFGWTVAFIYLSFQLYAAATAWITQRETKARAELDRSNSELRAMQLMVAQSVRVSERVRISRELHDVLGHDLTALTLNLEIVRNSPTDTKNELEVAQRVVKGLLKRVREVVSLLRADEQADLPRLLLGLASDGPPLKVHLDVSDDLESTDSGRAHALLRCVQEIITNARRHSGATNLWVEVRRDGANVVARARDDGHGVSGEYHKAGLETRGHGLTGIRERLGDFGGTLKLDPGAGSGFSLELILPLGDTAK